MTRPTNLRQEILLPIIIGSMLFIGALLSLFGIDYLLGDRSVLFKVFIAIGGLLFIGFCYWLYRKSHYRTAAIILSSFYFIITFAMTIIGSLEVTATIVLYSFVILLNSMLFGWRVTLPTAAIVNLAILLTASVIELGILPDYHAVHSRITSFSDVLHYIIFLNAFTLIGWLYGRDTEAKLTALRSAEKQLRRRNRQIETALADEKQKLRIAQTDELTTVYQFAELGRRTTTILHDLANQVTTLLLDVDEELGTAALHRTRRSIRHIESSIRQATSHIAPQERTFFPILRTMKVSIDNVLDNAARNSVEIILTVANDASATKVFGNARELQQVLEIVLNNAIQAYSTVPRRKKRIVEMTLQKDATASILTIKDEGIGIPLTQRTTIFEPKHTSKPHGHGIGLFVANQIISYHFNGTLSLEPQPHCTIFTIRLPLASHEIAQSTDQREVAMR